MITIIVAVADNGIIGAGGDLPWRASTDLRFFREATMGKPLIMGRKTFESLGKPLPGRDCVVVSRDPQFAAEGIRAAVSLDDALALVAAAPEIMIGGGGTIYRQAMPLADRLLVTRIHATPDGDTTFPEIAPAEWRRMEARDVDAGPKDTHPMTFETWERRR